ncbi:MAG: helix-turn-helix transcriptional regulator [bacterium]
MSELLTPRTPGAALRAAREKRRYSIADVVEATRIKTHVIEALENDDYSVMPAPLYGKGFIKIYAEHVGLDPEPLIRHYLSQYARSVRPTLRTELPPPTPMQDGLPVPSTMARFRESGGSAVNRMGNSLATAMRDFLKTMMTAWVRLQAARHAVPPLRSRLSSVRNDYSEATPIPVGRFIAIGFAILVVVIVGYGALSLFSSDGPASSTEPTTRKTVTKTVVSSSRPLRVAVPPPAPYIKLK